jgi:hypothetical protein
MELVPSREPAHDTTSGAPTPGHGSLGPVELRLAQAMNASELMYFSARRWRTSSRTKTCLKAARCDKTIREVARNCRAARFLVQLATLPTDRQEIANDA